MLRDYPFRFIQMPDDPASHAARLAVLHPLGGLPTCMPPDEAGPRSIQAGNALLKDWRRWLEDLQEAGLASLREPKAMQIARNCWPGDMLRLDSASLVQTPTRPCRIKDVCPWCWGRRAASAFRTVRGGFPVTGEACRLVTLVGQEFLEDGGDLCEALRRSAAEARRVVPPNRPRGAWLEVVAFPGATDDCRVGWDVESRLLLLLPWMRTPLVPLGWRASMSAEAWQVDPPDSEIQAHVAIACRYPVPLMRRDLSLLIELWGARRGLRLSEVFGSLRSRPGRREGGASCGTAGQES